MDVGGEGVSKKAVWGCGRGGKGEESAGVSACGAGADSETRVSI